MRYLTENTYQARLNNCGKKFIVIQCKNCEQFYLIQLHCGMRTCIKCSKKFSEKLKDSIFEQVKDFPETSLIKFRHIILSYGTEGSLERRIDKTYDAWRKIWNSYFKGKGNGALSCLEFGKENKSVHLHILFYGKYVKQSDLKKWFFKHTGKHQVYVKKTKGVGAIQEVVKYTTKGIEGGLTERYKIEASLFGRRRVRRYGKFLEKKKVLLPKEDLRKKTLKCLECGCFNWNRLESIYYVKEKGSNKMIRRVKPIVFDVDDFRLIRAGLFLLVYQGTVIRARASPGISEGCCE